MVITLDFWRIDFAENGIERGGFSRPGGARGKDKAVWFQYFFFQKRKNSIASIPSSSKGTVMDWGFKIRITTDSP